MFSDQVVPSETQENGQKESKPTEREEEEEDGEGKDGLSLENKSEASMETEPSLPRQHVDIKTGEKCRRRFLLKTTNMF